MSYVISGIQQVGIGVSNVDSAWAWYRRHFGMDVPVFRDAAQAPLMTRYTGDVVHSRDAVLALNLQGGSGMEIWQFTSREPAAPGFVPGLGDLGLLAVRIKARDVPAAFRRFRGEGLDVPGGVSTDPAGAPHVFVRDPHGLFFDVVASDEWFSRGPHVTGGPAGCMIGVSDVDRVLPLFQDVLRYDTVVYDEEGIFEDLAVLPAGGRPVRRVLLGHSHARSGPFSELFGSSEIELVQALDGLPGREIFRDRFWGDIGFIHLCFDVSGMDDLRSACLGAGMPFTVDSGHSFDMGEAAGRFAYIEDPDGTLIEFVETHRLPILRKLSWSLDLRRRSPTKPLPRWMIRALGMGRVKN